MSKKPNPPTAAARLLRRSAEVELRASGLPRKARRTTTAGQKSEADNARMLHELEVHQIELEMQNNELQKIRNELEITLEKYTDLYDFAPVGYFSLDKQGRILEVNLTGAALFGVERSRLINRRLPRFVNPASQAIFLSFLERVFAGTEKQVCEAALMKEDSAPFWASFHGISAISANGPRKWCRVAVSDITPLKQAQEAKLRMEALAAKNRELSQEIVRRQAVEDAIRQSERQQTLLLEQSRQMQEQLRRLSRQILTAQEDERRKISRELHDVIAQTLTGINVRLAALKKEAALNTSSLGRNIALTQRLVEKSVNIVHQFARELRPTVLDDLGLIPALASFLKHFTSQTGIRTHLTAFAGVEQLSSAQRTTLFRVTQQALTNVSRHAQASHAHVMLEKYDGHVGLKIKDNGKGFHVQRTLDVKKYKRLGLLGMKERVEMVGGNLTVESNPGQGTIIQAEIPLAAAPRTGSEKTR